MMPPNRDERQRLKRWLDLAEKLGDADAHGASSVSVSHSPLSKATATVACKLISTLGLGPVFSENPRYLCVRLKAGNGRWRLPKATAQCHATNREILDVNHLSAELSVCDGEDVLKRGKLKLSILVPVDEPL